MCHDYSTAHRKFQAARYGSSYGIFHICKHLTESQIVEYLFEILVSDVMAYNDVLSSPDLIFTHRGGCRAELRTCLLHVFPRGQYPPNIYLSCQWFSHNLFSSRAIVRVSVSYGLFLLFCRNSSFNPCFPYSLNGTPAPRSGLFYCYFPQRSLPLDLIEGAAFFALDLSSKAFNSSG